MYKYDKSYFEKKAKETGFIRDNLEKVYRLVDILEYINLNTLLNDCLLPVLRRSERFNLDVFKKRVKEFLEELFRIDSNEAEFMQRFKINEYLPELLFSGEMLERIKNHPMALWKTSQAKKG